MRDRKNLTKSLHTITAVTNVALHLAKISAGKPDPVVMVDSALQLLGQQGIAAWPKNDPTVAACVAKVTKLMEG